MERLKNNMGHPGTILKIKAKDFVSYSKLSFHPSPLVNILLAPNGAGKSSLLSAIVLGLGGKPSIIGKSNQISDFIMYGKDEARISINLHDPSEANDVIKVGRLIKKNGSTTWFLNKKKVVHKEVMAVMERLNIQIDSLCQVLPQERVQDFAKMNSIELLENVQRVIAGDLIVNYTNLIDYGKNLATLKETIATKTSLHQDAITKCTRLEKDVETIKEKQEVLKSVSFCKQKLIWMLYNDKKEEEDKVAGFVSESKKKLDSFERDLGPLTSALQKLENKCLAYRGIVEKKKTKVRDNKEHLRKVTNMIKMCNDKIELIKETRDRRLSEASTIQLRIKEAETKMNELSMFLTEENGDDLMQKVNNYDQSIKGKIREVQSTVEQVTQMKQEQVNLCNVVKLLESKLERANSVSVNRLNMLSNNNPDVHKGYVWLKENKHQFKSNIYGPILMELNMSLSEGAKYVEFIIPYRDLISFVTENSSDMTNLLRTLRDKSKLAVNCAHCDPPTGVLQQLYPPKIPLSQIKSIGFHCYLLDLIEGPPTVLKHLCNLYRVHLIPVAFNSKNIDRNIVAKYHGYIQMYFIGDELFRVSRSKYSNSTSITALKVRPAKFLADSINKEFIQQTQVEVNARRETLGELEGEMAHVVEHKNVLEIELNDLRNQKKSYAQRYEQFKSTTVRLRRHEEERMQLLNNVSDFQNLEKEAKIKIKDIVLTNKSRLTELLQWTKALSEDSISCTLSEYNLKISNHLRDSKKNELLSYEDEKQKLQGEHKELKKSLTEVKTDVSNLLTKAKESTEGLTMGEARFTELYARAFRKLPDKIDAIKERINSFQAKARCLANPLEEQHLKDYETSKAIAETISVELEKLSNESVLIKQNFDREFSSWLSEIDDVINELNLKFSDFFQKINCVGEVRLNKGEIHEAVEKYGLEIRVKFRNDTQLQVLDQYVQSGGERALTTAVFLLSLQRLSNLSFRCVDEINQGMDQFNERRVYNLLFNTITDSSSQYFLLTPKFLKGVTYPKICTIFNVYNFPVYKMTETEPELSQLSCISSDLDRNRNSTQHSSLTPLMPCKTESNKENFNSYKRLKHY